MPLNGKRIIVVVGSMVLGGAERQAILLARQLINEAGAEVQFFAFEHPDGMAAALCDRYRIPWRIVPFRAMPWRGRRRRWLEQLARFTLALRRERPDAILPYYMLPNIACGLTWRLSGAKVCVWNQRDEGIRAQPRFERWAARLTPCFAANSLGGARFLTDTFGIPAGAIHIVPNGVELATAIDGREVWRTRLGLAPDQFAGCMLGNLHIFKDHATLLHAWRIVVDRLSDGARPPVLLLAGKPIDTGDTLMRLAIALGIAEQVRFLGAVEDISGLLSAVDLGVHSSRAEGCPNAVLECMAAGLPVVATDIGGVRMALGGAAAACLAPVGDADALAERIVAMACDPALRSAAGKANQKRSAAEFSPRRMLDDTLAILAPYLDTARRKAA